MIRFYLTSLVLMWTILCGSVPSVLTVQFDSLGLGSRLSAVDILVSPSKRFELGIFAFGDPERAGRFQLAIRYVKAFDNVVTWIANRDIPLSSHAYVDVLTDGNLKLFDPDENPNNASWTANSAANLGIVKALLQDSGNLVLVDETGVVKWDSFKDSPSTDTLLPGQYLLKSSNSNLSSWATSRDPATGLYSFGWGGVNMSVLQLTWKSPKKFMNWTGGAYIPAPDVHSPHTIVGVTSVYFHGTLGHLYVTSLPADTLILSGGEPVSAEVLKRITIDTDGGFRIWQWKVGLSKSWTPVANWVITERPESRTQCTVMGTCGPYGWCKSVQDSLEKVICECPNGFTPSDKNDKTRGCVPINPLTDLNCNNTDLIKMEVLPGVDMPWGGDHKNLTGPDSLRCEEECLKDCDCAGASYSAQEQYCWLKMGPLFNIGYPTKALHGNDRTAYIKVLKSQALQPTVSHSESEKKIISLAVGVPVLFIILLFLGFCCCRRTDKPPKPKVVPPVVLEPIRVELHGKIVD